MYTINAETRDLKTNPRMLRRNGIIPGNIYGKSLSGSVHLQIPLRDVTALSKTLSMGHSLSVNVDGETHMCLLREISYTPGTANIEHISFQALVAGEAVTNQAQIVLLNRELVDGIVLSQLSELSYKALPKDLIGNIEIDLTGYNVGDQVSVEDLPEAKNEALEILTPMDALVFVVAEAKILELDEDVADEDADDVDVDEVDGEDEEGEDEA